MRDSNNVWALVLAAGDGRRLRGLTTTAHGLAIPKQFCSLERGPSLLQEALERARGVSAPERLCAIVAAQHRRWWADQLDAVPADNIIVQPENRGTANGILLSLLTILERDPQARIVLLPSDHHIGNEERLVRSLRHAASPPEPAGAQIILLGVEPRAPDPELGYIVPHHGASRPHPGIARFVEKPDAARAQALIAQGAVWNTFIMAADAAALLKLFERRCPDLVVAMRGAVRGGAVGADADRALAELYRALPDLDFSRSILQGQEQYLRVLPVPECGWSDLGTPQRVAEALEVATREEGRRARARIGCRVLLSLAAQHRQQRHAPAAAMLG